MCFIFDLYKINLTMKNVLLIFVLLLSTTVSAQTNILPLHYSVNNGIGYVTTYLGDDSFTDSFNQIVPQRVVLTYDDCKCIRPDSMMFLEPSGYVSYKIVNIINETNGSQTYEIHNKDGRGYVNLTIVDVEHISIYASYVRDDKQYSWSGVVN